MNSTQAAAQVVDLRPLIDIAITLVVTVLGAVGTWVGNWFVQKLKAEKGLLDEKQAESFRALVEQVVQGGIGYADELARQYGRDRGTIQVRNEMAAIALRYAVAAAPQALGALGVSQESLQRMILSRMPTPQGDIPQDALTPMRLPSSPANPGAAFVSPANPGAAFVSPANPGAAFVSPANPGAAFSAPPGSLAAAPVATLPMSPPITAPQAPALPGSAFHPYAGGMPL